MKMFHLWLVHGPASTPSYSGLLYQGWLRPEVTTSTDWTLFKSAFSVRIQGLKVGDLDFNLSFSVSCGTFDPVSS